VFGWEQNADFDISDSTHAGYSPYAYPYFGTKIDWPQRHGGDSFTIISPGESYIRADAYGIAAGVSTEQMWWGPGRMNTILMTNTAAGLPHAFLGTSTPVQTAIGSFQVQGVWARLTESDYFDDDDTNDRRLFVAFTATYSPALLDGLDLGFARVFYRSTEGVTGRDYVPFFQGVLKKNLPQDSTGSRQDAADQLISMFFDWSPAGSRFSVYGEWARDDHSWDMKDLVAEPDHSQAWIAGLEKLVPVGASDVRINAEVAHLGVYRGVSRRGTSSYYTNGTVRQGYTERGQLIGASIGPGSDSQYLGVVLWRNGNMQGLWIERVRWQDDAFYSVVPARFSYLGHDVELTAGLRFVHAVGPFDVSGGISFSSRRNRLFLACNQTTVGDPDCSAIRDHNVRVPLAVVWRP
jgi:hypothetical protein